MIIVCQVMCALRSSLNISTLISHRRVTAPFGIFADGLKLDQDFDRIDLPLRSGGRFV